MVRMLSLAVIVGAFALGTGVSAQDPPTPGSADRFETLLERLRGDDVDGSRAGNCVIPDRTQLVPVNGGLTIGGRSYRCVEVLDQELQRRAVAWTPGSKPAYTSEAMLRRIARGTAGTPNGADALSCALGDNAQHVVNTNVTVGGRTYHCVEVLDRNLEPVGAAWTPLVESRPF